MGTDGRIWVQHGEVTEGDLVGGGMREVVSGEKEGEGA